MAAKWSAMQMPKGARIDNEGSHNFTDPNSGGGPGGTLKHNVKRVPDAHKGGPYQPGQKQYASTSIRGTKGSTGNPASRGGMPSVGRQSFPSETRVPGHGGSPQHRGGTGMARQFGSSGQVGVPGVRTNPKPGVGNVGGRMAKRITGRFNNSSKGKRATGTVGSYGDRAPITANT